MNKSMMSLFWPIVLLRYIVWWPVGKLCLRVPRRGLPIHFLRL